MKNQTPSIIKEEKLIVEAVQKHIGELVDIASDHPEWPTFRTNFTHEAKKASTSLGLLFGAYLLEALQPQNQEKIEEKLEALRAGLIEAQERLEEVANPGIEMEIRILEISKDLLETIEPSQ